MAEDNVVEEEPHGALNLQVDELGDEYEPLDAYGNVQAKLWESDEGDQRVYLRVRDHKTGRGFNEYSVILEDPDAGKVRCASCPDAMVDPDNCDLSPAVCESCRRAISGEDPNKRRTRR